MIDLSPEPTPTPEEIYIQVLLTSLRAHRAHLRMADAPMTEQARLRYMEDRYALLDDGIPSRES